MQGLAGHAESDPALQEECFAVEESVDEAEVVDQGAHRPDHRGCCGGNRRRGVEGDGGRSVEER